MSSTEREKEKEIETENAFNVELNENNNHSKTTIDLNKIFHIDLSYNFDLLKDLLSTIIKNQKLKDDKILDLESQILDFKSLFNEIMNDPEKTKKIQESRASTILLRGKEFPNVSCLHYLISPPPNDIILEPSSKNDPIINQIIVSSILFIYIIKYIFINIIEKNKWYK